MIEPKTHGMVMHIQHINSNKRTKLDYKLTDTDLLNIDSIVSGWKQASFIVDEFKVTRNKYKVEAHD
tara:strand:+ start:9394 stop:9594 length:201 start_codon:yes stop_codon:yes gene_type:complete